MAVNDNDRVTTRRLKQFWDLAKPWIQNLVSGAIDTSEEAMDASVDTKIQAAKPDYTKPNIDGQIGDGFGYNDMVGNYANAGGSINFENMASYFYYDAHRPFKGNMAIRSQVTYMIKTLYTASNERRLFFKDFFKGFEGKLVGLTDQIVQNENFDIEEFVSNLDNLKSTYNDEEVSLISPVFNVGDDEYQTKLIYDGTSYALVLQSINGGEFVNQNTGYGNPWLAWCASYNNMPFGLGTCDIPNGSVNNDKLANYAVKINNLYDNVVDKLPRLDYNTRHYYNQYNSGTPTVKFPGPTRTTFTFYNTSGNNTNSGAYRLNNFSFFGTKEQLTESSYWSAGNPARLITLDENNSMITVPVGVFSNMSQIRAPFNVGSITEEGVTTIVNGAMFCILSVETETTNKVYFGRLIFEGSDLVSTIKIKVLDPSFFADFVAGSTLYVQTLSTLTPGN